MTGVFGWTATIILTMCALPQFIKMIKTRSVKDISVVMWWAYLIGHLFAITYAALIWQPPLLIKYGFNIFISIIILITYYKLNDS